MKEIRKSAARLLVLLPLLLAVLMSAALAERVAILTVSDDRFASVGRSELQGAVETLVCALESRGDTVTVTNAVAKKESKDGNSDTVYTTGSEDFDWDGTGKSKGKAENALSRALKALETEAYDRVIVLTGDLRAQSGDRDLEKDTDSQIVLYGLGALENDGLAGLYGAVVKAPELGEAAGTDERGFTLYRDGQIAMKETAFDAVTLLGDLAGIREDAAELLLRLRADGSLALTLCPEGQQAGEDGKVLFTLSDDEKIAALRSVFPELSLQLLVKDAEGHELARLCDEDGCVTWTDTITTRDTPAEIGFELLLRTAPEGAEIAREAPVAYVPITTELDALDWKAEIAPADGDRALRKRGKATVTLEPRGTRNGRVETWLAQAKAVLLDAEGQTVAELTYEDGVCRCEAELPARQGTFVWKLQIASPEGTLPAWSKTIDLATLELSNAAPTLSGPDAENVDAGFRQGETWRYTLPELTAEDPDGDPTRIEYTVLLDGEEREAQIEDGRLTVDAYGTWTLEARAADDDGGLSEPWTVTIVACDSDRAPCLVEDKEPVDASLYQIAAGYTVTLPEGLFLDEDGDACTLRIARMKDGSQVGETEKIAFTGTSPERRETFEAFGRWQLLLQAVDRDGQTSETASVTVELKDALAGAAGSLTADPAAPGKGDRITLTLTLEDRDAYEEVELRAWLERCEVVVIDGKGGEIPLTLSGDKTRLKLVSDTIVMPDTAQTIEYKAQLRPADRAAIDVGTLTLTIEDQAPETILTDEQIAKEAETQTRYALSTEELVFEVPQGLFLDADDEELTLVVTVTDGDGRFVERSTESKIALSGYGLWHFAVHAEDPEGAASPEIVWNVEYVDALAGLTGTLTAEPAAPLKNGQTVLTLTVGESKVDLRDWLSACEVTVSDGENSYPLSLTKDKKALKLSSEPIAMPGSSGELDYTVRIVHRDGRTFDEVASLRLTIEDREPTAKADSAAALLTGTETKLLLDLGAYRLDIPQDLFTDEDDTDLSTVVTVRNERGENVLETKDASIGLPGFGTWTVALRAEDSENARSEELVYATVRLVDLKPILAIAGGAIALIAAIAILLVVHSRNKKKARFDGETGLVFRLGDEDVSARLRLERGYAGGVPLSSMAVGITVRLSNEQWNELDAYLVWPDKEQGAAFTLGKQKKVEGTRLELPGGLTAQIVR